jgi:hypothetical protein
MNIRQKIAKLQQQIKLRELTDDGYFISRQYREDCRALYELKRLLQTRH